MTAASAFASDIAIDVKGLSKSFGGREVVHDLSMQVKRGTIYGFLGPNGSGKTTTIRMLLGLVRPTAGRVELFGRDVAAHGDDVLPRVGALVEAPAFYPYLSGRDNLRAVGSVLGGTTAARLDEVLELVDLRGRQRDRVRSYSLGMKQRLGVATALLDDPDLLVLDEPANGLDPAGIREMRDLMRSLAASGRTVFISSHVLAEVQQTCDRVGIVSRGRLARLAPVSELMAASGEFEVRLDAPHEALALLGVQPWGAAARVEGGVLVSQSPTGTGWGLLDFLVSHGQRPDGLVERRQTLEDIFLALTGTAHGGMS
jgi:ABC-2 type transport system ATP-binding protein